LHAGQFFVSEQCHLVRQSGALHRTGRIILQNANLNANSVYGIIAKRKLNPVNSQPDYKYGDLDTFAVSVGIVIIIGSKVDTPAICIPVSLSVLLTPTRHRDQGLDIPA